MAKAALKIGDVGDAYDALKGHNGGTFENDEDNDAIEVKDLWERANQAVDKAEKASNLAKQGGHDQEAATLMREASTLYPEAKALSQATEFYDQAAAFERKDYDTFLASSRRLWEERPGAVTAAGVASALACKYAVTRDPAYRNEAEAMLRQGEQQTKQHPEELKDFQEYAERINYRLISRKTIDTPEYNR
jgi:hypothetical protein